MRRRVSYKGQFVSDGKDPLRARSDHYADSIGGGLTNFWMAFYFLAGGKFNIQDLTPMTT